MNKSKIEWCDRTWNPVTGCLHNCPYCYARVITQRFGGRWNQSTGENVKEADKKLHDIGMPLLFQRKNGDLVNAAFPYVFDPTFHKYRLDEPTRFKEPQNIFVCSMADLFGDWVPKEWIKQVFEACETAPQHRYLFLTKNPRRYLYTLNVALEGFNLDNCYFGATITNESDKYFYSDKHNVFLSIEPIQSSFEKGSLHLIKWVIIGAETGNRKGKIIPKKEWVQNIVEKCREQNIPIFMKDSLKDIWKEPLIREYPW
jgi:protein gp37